MARTTRFENRDETTRRRNVLLPMLSLNVSLYFHPRLNCMTGLTLMIPLNLTFSRQNHENLLNYLDLIQTEIRCLFTFSRFVLIRLYQN